RDFDPFSGAPVLWHGTARRAWFAPPFRLSGINRLSLVRPNHCRGRQFFAGKQHPHSANLYGDAIPEWGNDPDHLHAPLAAEYYSVYPRDLPHDRDRWDHAARRIDLRKLAVRRRAPAHDRSRDLHRDQAFPVGEGGKTARFRQTLGAGGVAAFSFPWG